jgi:hypothetical protein
MMDFLKKSVSWPLGTEPLCEIIDGGSQNENGQTTIGIALKIESSINPHDLKREVGTMRMKALLIPLMKEINAKKDFSSVDDVSVELLDHELKLRFSNYESTLSGLDDIKYLTEKMVEMANTINENIGIQTINLKTETREAKEFLEYTAENNSEETLELSCRINQKDDRRTISASKTISILEQELIKLYEWKKALQNQGSPIQVEFNYNQPVDDSETWITIGF